MISFNTLQYGPIATLDQAVDTGDIQVVNEAIQRGMKPDTDKYSATGIGRRAVTYQSAIFDSDSEGYASIPTGRYESERTYEEEYEYTYTACHPTLKRAFMKNEAIVRAVINAGAVLYDEVYKDAFATRSLKIIEVVFCAAAAQKRDINFSEWDLTTDIKLLKSAVRVAVSVQNTVFIPGHFIRRDGLSALRAAAEAGAKVDTFLLDGAIRTTDPTVIDTVLQAGCKPACSEGSAPGANSLDAALNTHHLPTIQRIIAVGARPSQHSLSCALETRDPAIVNVILRLNARPSASTLYEAIDSGDISLLRTVVGAGATFDPAKDKDGADALRRAIRTQKVSVVRTVIALGAKPLNSPFRGTLDEALETDDADIVRAILSLGASTSNATRDILKRCQNREIHKMVKGPFNCTIF